MRNDYGNDFFLDTDYDQSAIFVRSVNDQQSILGAYAYLLGLYPDTVDGITLEPDIEAIGDVAVKDFEVSSVRSKVRLGSPRKTTAQGRIFPGNPDALFLTKLNELYPGVSQKVDQQLFDAKVEYEATHGTHFYEEFADAIHRPIDNVNFYSVFRYADDILTTKANGESSSVNLSRDLMDKLSVYYGHYFGNGLFRDQALTRAFSHTYLTSVAHELQIKMEDDQSGAHKNQGIHEFRHSVYLSNHLTLLAALNLFNEIEDYHVDFNDELRFQLFKKDGKYFVRTTLNEKPLTLEGTGNSEGEAEWTSWRDYICSKLYYGDLSKVRSGNENPSEHVKIRGSCSSFLSNAFYVNDKVQLKDHDRAPVIPEEPTPVPVTKEKPRSASSSSILINNMDEGVRSQSVDINAGRTTETIQYAFYRPIKLKQTQTRPFDIPMRQGFSFTNLSKKDVNINQFRKIKIKTTTNIEVKLAESHKLQFEHDLLKTREITFTNVDLVKIQQMSQKTLFLADKHQFNWGENPSFSSKNNIKFNHYSKIKIPVTVSEEFALPEMTTFNYNTNSLDVKKVNFNHIKSVRVKQAESYDVSLKDFKFSSLRKDNSKTADRATSIDTPYNNNPIPKTTSVTPKSTKGVSLGGNTSTDKTYIAPIRIKQEYSTSGVHTTADKTNDSKPSLKKAPEPAPVIPEFSPPVTAPKSEPEESYPRYTPPKTYPTYQSATKPAEKPAAKPATSTASTTKPASTTSTTSTAKPASSTSIPSSRYPSYGGTGSNRGYTPYSRRP